MVCPSGANAVATGWLPSVPSGQVSIFSSLARRLPASTSEMESAWPFATASSFSSGLSARADGARPTGTSRVEKSCASIAVSVPETDEPVRGSVATIEPLDGATVSDFTGRHPPRLVTKTCVRDATTPNDDSR